MKLSMLPVVTRAVEARGKVINAIADAEAGWITVHIGPHYGDDALTAAAKASILSELRARKASLERDLESYGIELGDG